MRSKSGAATKDRRALRRPGLAWIGLLACLLAGRAQADLIIFTDELTLKGKVRRITDEHVIVHVFHGEWGEVVIPRSRVKRIEYDVKSRRKVIDSDDVKGLYALGKWAFEQGLHDDALETLLPLVGKPGVPDEIHALLLRIYETRDDLDKALQEIVALLKKQPGDKDLARKLAACRRDLGLKPGEGPGASLAGGGGAPSRPTGGAVPAQPTPPAGGGAKTRTREGIEKLAWRREGWGNPCQISTYRGADGNHMLSIAIPADGGKDKTTLSTGHRTSLVGKTALHMSIYNGDPKRPFNVAVALVAGNEYFESMHRTIRPGWNMDLSIDVSNSRWKSAKTNWQFTTKIIKPEAVTKLFLLIYNGRREVSFFFDDIRFE